MKLSLAKRKKRQRSNDSEEDPFGAEVDDDQELDGNALDEDGRDNNRGALDSRERAKRDRKKMNARLQAVNEINAQVANNDAKAQGVSSEELDKAFKAAREKQSREAEASGNKDAKSRYISRLLETAQERELRHERAREKLIRKTIEEESKDLGAPTEIFVTDSYKKKLQERELWEQEEERKEKESQSQRSLGAFNRAFLMGDDPELGGSNSAASSSSSLESSAGLAAVSGSRIQSREDVPATMAIPSNTQSINGTPKARSLISTSFDSENKAFASDTDKLTATISRCRITAEELEAARQRATERYELRRASRIQ